MKTSWRAGVALGLSGLTAAAFLTGRHLEQELLAAQAKASPQLSASARAPEARAEEKYRELKLGDILAMPFADFYEALRAAPAAAREKWTAELAAMPEGPQRSAATNAYYKLLVQFDPTAAAKAVTEIEDKDMQTYALLVVAAAAPASALPEMAKMGFSLRDAWPDYISGFPRDLLRQWSEIDPPAVAEFLDTLPEDDSGSYDYTVVGSWAASDPKAALAWTQKHENLRGVAGEFFEGWYTYDREAALGFALANATKEFPREALPTLLRKLYQDSPAEAKKFLGQLPNDDLRRTALSKLDFQDNMGPLELTGEPELVPRTMGDWITQFPPDTWKGQLSGVFGFWADGSPDEVFAWIAQQPAQKKSAVAAEYQKPWSKTMPEAAADIFQFASPDLREQLLEAMVRNSSDQDQEMQKAIGDSSLLPAQKEHVIQVAQRVAAAKAEEQAEWSRQTRLQIERENQGSEK